MKKTSTTNTIGNQRGRENGQKQFLRDKADIFLKLKKDIKLQIQETPGPQVSLKNKTTILTVFMVRERGILITAVKVGEAPATSAVLARCEPSSG